MPGRQCRSWAWGRGWAVGILFGQQLGQDSARAGPTGQKKDFDDVSSSVKKSHGHGRS